MSISYTAYVFIGAEIDEDHFYERGDVTLHCYHHGQQEKRFCGDCGKECHEEAVKLWTPEMVRAAETYNTTPDALWDHLMEDGGKCFSSDREDIAFWKFGYENDYQVFGRPVAMVRDDDRPGIDNSNLSLDEMNSVVTEVKGAFKAYGIELPIRIFAIQDCG